MKRTAAPYLSRILPLIFSAIFFFTATVSGQKKFSVEYVLADKDSSYKLEQLALKSLFESKESAESYVLSLPQTLLGKGFPTASVDSASFDSAWARVVLYRGVQYKWVQINTDSIDKEVLSATGWNEKQFENKRINFSQMQLQQERILNYYENSGYPFASVFLDQIDISGNGVKGALKVRKGVLYHIDSITVWGNVKIKNAFLQHYLALPNGSVYNREKLNKVSKLIAELPFMREKQPWKLTMLGTGSYLNLFLEPVRSSQVNVLVGFLPGNSISQKSQLTADVHLDLKNALASGENILLNWQQLQPQSPRLNLGYKQPYILNSNFGIDFSFDLLKRDSAYLQLNAILGIQYLVSANQSFKLFYQNQSSILLSGGVDTILVLHTKKLPVNMDVTSSNIGIGYHFENTNYRLNPRMGNEFDITGSVGIRKTSKSNDIVNLKDPARPDFDFNLLYDSIQLKTYQFKIVASGAHYFPFGKNNTVKTVANFGVVQSPQMFRNELFQIGGYKLLRGFDEESIYANQYAVFTTEYRYLLGINSYFFGFSDLGLTKTKYTGTSFSNSFISMGAGVEFETRFGLLNLSYALGKRNDVKFDLRNSSKIHFGYINYF